MQQKEQYTLPVLDMNSEGTGICRQDSMVIFVPRTVTGDTIRLEIRERQKNFAKGECLEILTPSAKRCEPDCPWYESCGGCTLRHVTREAELQVKENTVRQALRRMHLETAEGDIRPILYTEPTAYRNKAMFHFSGTGELGYYARESHTVMPGSTDCCLLPTLFREIAAFTKTYLQQNEPAFHPETLYLRRNAENSCMAAIQTDTPLNDRICRILEDYADALQQRFPGKINGILHSDHPKGKYAVPEYTVIRGDRYLYESYNGLIMRISPEGFCQVNKAGAEHLAQTVLRFAEECVPKGPITAADLYCGSGFFGLHLAKAFPDWRIYGIEINPESIRDAEVNREQNRLNNIRFRCGDAAELFEKEKEKLHFAVIDPPRAGCSERMRRQILELAPESIAYVSCNPQTLARDLAEFVKGGYTVQAVQPVDMFPGTEHVETVVLMSKKA